MLQILRVFMLGMPLRRMMNFGREYLSSSKDLCILKTHVIVAAYEIRHMQLKQTCIYFKKMSETDIDGAAMLLTISVSRF